MAKPKVSVVIPAYNAERTIKQTLDSIKSQKYFKNEFVGERDSLIIEFFYLTGQLMYPYIPTLHLQQNYLQ